jgi:hypothetical protein
MTFIVSIISFHYFHLQSANKSKGVPNEFNFIVLFQAINFLSHLYRFHFIYEQNNQQIYIPG